MKKLLVFIVALVMTLSIITVSFAASISLETISPYLGLWVYSSTNSQRALSIGNNGNEYVAQLLISYQYNQSKNTSMREYVLTYDEVNKTLYLTDSSYSVSYRLVIENGKIIITSMEGTVFTYEKVQ